MKTLVLAAAILVPVLASGSAQAFNHRPLPTSVARIGMIKMLNPQPLPPKALGSSFVNPGVKALNPQPLPPRWNMQNIRIGR